LPAILDLLCFFGGQLARAENSVLQAKVKELVQRVKVLAVENEALKVEVEIYRKEAALPSFSNLALGNSGSDMETEKANDGEAFFRSGNGVFPRQNEVTFRNLHGPANPLTCALSPDDTVLATGGADGQLMLCGWGAVYSPSESPDSVVQSASGIGCEAPVICVAFAPTLRGILAVGCMDGSIYFVQYSSSPGSNGIDLKRTGLPKTLHHKKYVRAVVWSPKGPLVATSSADGTVHLFKVERTGMELSELSVSLVTSLHLPGAVESMIFSDDHLICYARGTAYLSYFEIAKNFGLTKINLNAGTPGTASYEDHVSFAVMDMALYQNKYLALATDISRNIVLDVQDGKQIRNLYGHENDGFSQPKIAWSSNGSYLLGNTQHESCLCVWDIASAQVVERLEGHGQPVRAIYSSQTSDIVITTSFDKAVKFWFPQNESM
jgi:WD40 repeat protein